MARTYGRIEKPIPEDVTKCVEAVYAYDMWSRQCSRLRGHGPNKLYCKQHAKGKS